MGIFKSVAHSWKLRFDSWKYYDLARLLLRFARERMHIVVFSVVFVVGAGPTIASVTVLGFFCYCWDCRGC